MPEYEPCEECPPVPPICKERIYFGVVDSFCTQKKLPNCDFTIRMLYDPYQRIFPLTTGYLRYQPIDIICDTTYEVNAYYFGDAYQSTPVSFKFKVDNQWNVQVWDVSGLQLPMNHIIVNTYGGQWLEILIPVIPAFNTQAVRIKLETETGAGLPNYSFILSDTSTGKVVGEVMTTDPQGYTPYMYLIKGKVYHINEVEITTYYNPNNMRSYKDFIPDWDDVISFDVWSEWCSSNLHSSPNHNGTITCNSSGCTITFVEPDRNGKFYIKKVGPSVENVNGANFNLTDLSTGQTIVYTTNKYGRTPFIL